MPADLETGHLGSINIGSLLPPKSSCALAIRARRRFANHRDVVPLPRQPVRDEPLIRGRPRPPGCGSCDSVNQAPSGAHRDTVRYARHRPSCKLLSRKRAPEDRRMSEQEILPRAISGGRRQWQADRGRRARRRCRGGHRDVRAKPGGHANGDRAAPLLRAGPGAVPQRIGATPEPPSRRSRRPM